MMSVVAGKLKKQGLRSSQKAIVHRICACERKLPEKRIWGPLTAAQLSYLAKFWFHPINPVLVAPLSSTEDTGLQVD